MRLEVARICLDWLVGEWDGLGRAARRLVDAAGEVRQLCLFGDLVAGRLALAAGARAEAERHLRAALRTARATGMLFAEADAAAGLARLRRGKDPAAAWREASPTLERVDATGAWRWSGWLLPELASTLCDLGRQDQASTLVARAEAGLAGRDAPLAHAALGFSRGLLARSRRRWDEAVGQLAQAHDDFDALGAPYPAAQAQTALGCVLLSAGQEDEGKGCLVQARDVFHGLGAASDYRGVQREAERHGVRLSPRTPGRRPLGRELSGSERRVARLAAEGLSNSQIAARLNLSTKTVEHHLRSTLRKLDLTSRQELGDRLADGGGPRPTPEVA
jgi:DNA-binding CsgD family transcriptional regulator